MIRYIPTRSAPSAEQTQTWLSWFDAGELQRWQRFQQAPLQQRFLLSHALLRGVMAEVAQCHPRELAFTTLPQGKPILSRPQGSRHWHFNLSHTEGLAAVAISPQPVGIDLEYLQRRGPKLTVAARYFTAREYQDILSHPSAAQPHRLLSYWTFKEAYLKAEGWKISRGLDAFEFALQDDGSAHLHALEPHVTPRHAWQFRQFLIEDQHLCALAALASPAQNPLRWDCAPWQAISSALDAAPGQA